MLLIILALYGFVALLLATLFAVLVVLQDWEPDEPKPPFWFVLTVAGVIGALWPAIVCAMLLMPERVNGRRE